MISISINLDWRLIQRLIGLNNLTHLKKILDARYVRHSFNYQQGLTIVLACLYKGVENLMNQSLESWMGGRWPNSVAKKTGSMPGF